MRKTIIITLDDHKVTSCILSEEDGWTREMHTAEAAAYLLARTDLMEIALSYTGPLPDKLGKEQVLAKQREFQYQMATRIVFDEAFGQITPWMALKLMMIKPLLSILEGLAAGDCHRSSLAAFFRRFVLPSARRVLMVLLFGWRNAKQMEALLEEIHQKYYGS